MPLAVGSVFCTVCKLEVEPTEWRGLAIVLVERDRLRRRVAELEKKCAHLRNFFDT